MDSASHSPPQSLPDSSSSVATRRGQSFVPLSSHGMPKTPYPPEGSTKPHRFSTIGAPSQLASPPMSPRGPMSPPMSAKSFGTFIDSAPSTPAYSPHMSSGWDGSTLRLLSPVSSAPSSPPEPQWEMMTPSSQPASRSRKATTPLSLNKEIAMGTSLSSHPFNPIPEERQKENTPPASENGEQAETEAERKTREEQASHVAPLGKLATRMKSILRRRSSGEKKGGGESRSERRRKKYQDLDYMEDVHWTEM